MAVQRLKSGRDRYATPPERMPDRLEAVRDNRPDRTETARNPANPV